MTSKKSIQYNCLICEDLNLDLNDNLHVLINKTDLSMINAKLNQMECKLNCNLEFKHVENSVISDKLISDLLFACIKNKFIVIIKDDCDTYSFCIIPNVVESNGKKLFIMDTTDTYTDTLDCLVVYESGFKLTQSLVICQSDIENPINLINPIFQIEKTGNTLFIRDWKYIEKDNQLILEKSIETIKHFKSITISTN